MRLVTDIGPLYNQFSAVVSPDRKYYYTVLNKVEKRDFATNTLLATADVDKSYYTIQVSSDGKKVYLGGAATSILVYDTGTMKLLRSWIPRGTRSSPTSASSIGGGAVSCS